MQGLAGGQDAALSALPMHGHGNAILGNAILTHYRDSESSKSYSFPCSIAAAADCITAINATTHALPH